MPPWLLFVILIVVILIIIWILISGNPKEETPETTQTTSETAETGDEEVEPVVVGVAPDDLKKIEGIGPRIAGLLAEHGILTFKQLADAPTEKLQAMLDDAGIRIADPGTWSEQANLAAKGEWEELTALQDSLKGGRREE